MKRLVKILIVALLLTGASQAWAQLGPTSPDFNPDAVAEQIFNDGGGDTWAYYELAPNYEQLIKQNFPESGPGSEYSRANLNAFTRFLESTDRSGVLDSLLGNIRGSAAANISKVVNYSTAWQQVLNGSRTEGQINQAQQQIKEKVLPQCGYLDLGCYILRVVASIGWLLVQIFGKLADVANNIFNFAMNLSVREFSQYAKIPGVKNAWSVCRDLVNISFIFILLYVAIGTILQLGSVNGKHLLKNVIIAALLVNFSFFFTSIIIDASNVTANAFYNLAARNVETGEAEQGFFDAPDIISPITNAASNGMESHLVREFGGISSQDNLMNQFGAIIASYFGQIVLLLVTTTVLFAGAIMFLIRTIVLIFVLVLSPLAFLGMAVGGSGLGKIASKWKDALTNQVIFAPVYLLCIFLTIQMVTSTGGLRSLSDSGQGGSFAGSLLVFAIINGMMVGSLLVAKELGVAGAAMASKAGGGLTGFGSRLIGKPLGMAAKGSAYGLAWLPTAATTNLTRATGRGLAGIGARIGSSRLAGYGARMAKDTPSAANVLSTAGKGINKGIGWVEKKAPGVKPFTDAFRKPGEALNEAMSAATGVAVLGRTVDEEKERKKREKEEKETRDAQELDEKKRNLKRSARLIEDGKITPGSAEEKAVKEELQKMSNKNIVKLDPDTMTKLARLMSDSQIEAIEGNDDVKTADKEKIREARELPLRAALNNLISDPTNAAHKSELVTQMSNMSDRTLNKFVSGLNESSSTFASQLQTIAEHLEAGDIATLSKIGGIERKRLKAMKDARLAAGLAP